MPIRHTLGRRFVKHESAATSKSRPTKRKKDEMMFIPISKTIQRFTANASFRSLVMYRESREGYFSSVEDESRYKIENWWKENDESFHIKLYSDEVDMCDGLGSKYSGQQKLLMIYASLTDIDPVYQSQLLFNFLVGIVRAEDVKRCGINRILRPIVDDIKLLEEKVDGPDDTIIKAGLFATIGDNLSQNGTCGLKESFGKTLHCCRFCLADLTQIQTLTEERLDLIRNPKEHGRQVSEIENADDVVHCLPRFAALYSILLRDEDIMFICKKVQTVEYNTDLIAYEEIIAEEYISIHPANIINHEIFHTESQKISYTSQ